MVRWLSSIPERLRRREERDGAPGVGPVLDLLAVAGHDAGRSFTLDGAHVTVGRGRAAPGEPSRPDRIWLRDPSVSSSQAVIRRDPGGTLIEAIPGATNPTCVNGRPVDRAPLKPGDRISMGHVVLEVRAHTGPALSGFFDVSAELRREASNASTGRRDAGRPEAAIDSTERIPTSMLDRTETRPIASTGSHLLLEGGIDGWEQRRFWLRLDGPTVIGRHADCEVSLPEPGVSRRHAEILIDRGRWVIAHLSRVNPTLVNGRVVQSRAVLSDGDEIQLADRVTLRLTIDPTDLSSRADPPASLRERMEEKLRWEQALRDEFSVRGAFLDVDVVDSYGLKTRDPSPEARVVSFERFRAFVGAVVSEHAGLVLNSNGDELMCFFEEPLQGVRAASSLLERLGEWNRAENALSSDFRVRCGLHAGDCLLDRARGVAYSEVLDVAGHLQKAAEVDGLLISEEALRQLPPGLPFESAGKLEKNGVAAWRLAGPLSGTGTA